MFEKSFLAFVYLFFVSMTQYLCPETGTEMCSLKIAALKFIKFKDS